MHTTLRRYWPDGSYCPEGRDHLSWVTIATTADAASIEAVGTEGPIQWCGCSDHAWVAA